MPPPPRSFPGVGGNHLNSVSFKYSVGMEEGLKWKQDSRVAGDETRACLHLHPMSPAAVHGWVTSVGPSAGLPRCPALRMETEALRAKPLVRLWTGLKDSGLAKHPSPICG